MRYIIPKFNERAWSNNRKLLKNLKEYFYGEKDIDEYFYKTLIMYLTKSEDETEKITQIIFNEKEINNLTSILNGYSNKKNGWNIIDMIKSVKRQEIISEMGKYQ